MNVTDFVCEVIFWMVIAALATALAASVGAGI